MRTCLLGLCGALMISSGPASAQEVSYGLAKDNAWSSQEHIALMESHGLTDHATIYYKLMSAENLANPYAWVRDNYLDADIPTVVTLIIDDGVSSTVGTSEGTDVSAGVPGLLQQVISGVFDDALMELADEISRDGRPVTVRPFHELDGGWYEWGMYATGNSPELAVQAIEHVIGIFDEMGAANVSWEINFNRRDGRGQVLGEAELLLPRLNEVVDAYSVSTYNRCGTASRYDEERSFADDFSLIYERITALSDLPVNVAEVSTSGICAPRIEWFEKMLTDIETRFPRTEMVTFFFGVVPVGKASNDVPIYWGFDEDPELLPEFRELILSQEEASTPTESKQAQSDARTTRVVQATRPVLRPVRPTIETIADTQTVLTFGSERSWSWEAWGDLRTTFGDEPIPGYGTAGTIAQATVRFNYLDEGAMQSGPSILLGGVLSDNCDERYWQCQMRAEASYIWRWRPAEFGDYNRLQFGLGVGYRYYTDGPPSRLENGDAYGFVGLTWVAGGDFKN